jgi:ubiquinone/menaquinone biosynthesis C-methylase UbiE
MDKGWPKSNVENEDVLTEKDRLYQGEKASEIFRGEVEVEPIKIIFGESARLIAEVIRKHLNAEGGTYRLADFGSHKGELLENICKLLPEYNFQTTGIDLENNLKENKTTQEKVAADLGNLPIKESSIDIGFARYVLHWNNREKQEQILKEIVRIVKKFAIIQHVGADSEKSAEWREKVNDLLDGKEIPKLERHGHFFSSREELEKFMEDNNISFERISEIRVDDLSETLSQRFSLDKKEKQLAKTMLVGNDYIIQTTWLIRSAKSV